MSEIAEKWFRGYELGAYGLVTQGVGGTHSSGEVEVAETVVPGRDVPSITLVRTRVVPMAFACVVADETHEGLVCKLDAIKAILDPKLLFQEWRIEDRPTLRTFARVLSIPIDIDALPYITTVAQFRLTMERYPWWEDAEPQTLTLTGATLSGTASNSGTKTAYPIYTATVTAPLASGLTITVGGQVFTYTGALVASDVLVVTTDDDLPDVALNGVRDFTNTAPDAAYPVLAVGDTTITKSSASFNLDVSWRRRRD